MLFNRVKLIETIRAAVAQQEMAFNLEQDQKREAANVEAREWVERYTERWRDAVETISAKLDAGEPILRGDIPDNGRGYREPLHFVPTTFVEKTYVPEPDLMALLAILEAGTDESVSTSSLKDHGVANLRRLVPNIGATVQR